MLHKLIYLINNNNKSLGPGGLRAPPVVVVGSVAVIKAASNKA